MAIPYSGLLYPGSAAYLWLDDTALAIEVTEVAHLVFGGVCMWLLIRLFGMSWLSGLAAAMTVMMSGSIALQINFPVLVQGMMWLPATILAVEHTLRGGRFAPPCLAGVVALQVLNGSTEFLVYNLYAAGLFALFALTRDAAMGHVRGAMIRGVVLMAAVLLGVGLAGVQLLPSLELVAESARAGGAGLVTFYRSSVPPAELLVGVLGSSGAVGVGVLPLLGVCLGGSQRGRANRRRTLWLYALTLATAAALLAAGGTIFELYSQTPIGSLFRRPNKLLHLWAFAGGLLAALAIAQLEQWRTQALSPQTLRSRVSWRVAFALCAAGTFGTAIRAPFNPYLLAASTTLLIFAIVDRPAARSALIAAIVAAQGADLFMSSKNVMLRPYMAPQLLDLEEPLFDRLAAARDGGRIHLSAELRLDRGLMFKQGTLRGIPVVMDKQPLTMSRHQHFLLRAAGAVLPREGNVTLMPGGAWRLLDLMSTRYYVLKKAEAFEQYVAELASMSPESDFSVVGEGPNYRVYERAREHWLPRAFVVQKVRELSSQEDVLSALAAPDFNAREELLLEAAQPAGATGPLPTTVAADFEAEARIVVDEPERIEIEVRSSAPGHLVLSDSDYPGWRATIDGEIIPILRANYLFRAVPIPEGHSRAVFEFLPSSLRYGLLVSAAAAFLLAGVTILWLRREIEEKVEEKAEEAEGAA